MDIEIIERNQLVDKATAELKRRFIGIDRQIDQVMAVVRTWYLYPGCVPERLVSRTADSESQGFMIEEDNQQDFASKRDMLNKIKVLLEGDYQKIFRQSEPKRTLLPRLHLQNAAMPQSPKDDCCRDGHLILISMPSTRNGNTISESKHSSSLAKSHVS